LNYLDNQIEKEVSELDKLSEDLGIDPFQFKEREPF